MELLEKSLLKYLNVKNEQIFILYIYFNGIWKEEWFLWSSMLGEQITNFRVSFTCPLF